jgi:hypothetical protein
LRRGTRTCACSEASSGAGRRLGPRSSIDPFGFDVSREPPRRVAVQRRRDRQPEHSVLLLPRMARSGDHRMFQGGGKRTMWVEPRARSRARSLWVVNSLHRPTPTSPRPDPNRQSRRATARLRPAVVLARSSRRPRWRGAGDGSGGPPATTLIGRFPGAQPTPRLGLPQVRRRENSALSYDKLYNERA